MEFKTLYKKTSTGAIQYWTISVKSEIGEGCTNPDGSWNDDNEGVRYGLIVTEYGQINTTKPQVFIDPITKGKNIGKKNATSAFEQAQKEAVSRYEKQLKNGYVDSIEKALANSVDDLIEGGIVPMLAQSFSKHGHKIKYPCYAQPKLDGIRCIAILKDGVCTLWSRTRKPITGVPHIARAVEDLFNKKGIASGKLDGELYNHDLKHDFEQIVSHVRQEIPQPGHEIVQYHVYDAPIADLTFDQRISALAVVVGHAKDTPIRLVSSFLINSEDDVMEQFEVFTATGYEGLMLRNADSLYVNKKSYDLQKVKEFDDAEFKIIGIKEGRGKLAGHAIHVCVDSKGEEFDVKLKGDTEILKKHFEDHSLWEGKLMTVQFQGLTGAKQLPRFPVGKAVRDYE